MENLLHTARVPVTRTVVDARDEYVISGDYVLPEYCPDMAVVLKCRITPRIQSRRRNGDQLLLEGTALVCVLYLDEERRCVREAEFSQPLSCALRGAGGAETEPVRITLTPEYVNCRATGPRRLEVRGAFAVHAQADAAEQISLAEAAEDPALYVQTVEVPVSAPVASAEKMLMISDVLEFDGDLPPAEQLLGGDDTVVVQECKLLTGKAIVKGQILVHRLYTDDSSRGTTHLLDYTVPFSQIVDLDGARDGMQAIAEVSVLSDTVRCVADPAGQNRMLEIGYKLSVQVQVYDSRAVSLITDAYHSRYPSVPERQGLTLRALTGTQRQTATLGRDLDLPSDTLQEILDIRVGVTPLACRCEGGKAKPGGRLAVSLLVRDNDGIVSYYERPEEFELEYAADGNTAEVSMAVTDVRYAVAGGKLNLRVTLLVTLCLWDVTQPQAVTGVTLREDQPYPPERAGIKLYFAGSGERVWDIARHCHASPAGICAENDLNGESLAEPCVLLIPLT